MDQAVDLRFDDLTDASVIVVFETGNADNERSRTAAEIYDAWCDKRYTFNKIKAA